MDKVKEAPRPLGGTQPKGPVDRPSGKIGWDVAVVVIIGTTLAVMLTKIRAFILGDRLAGRLLVNSTA